jgi:RNA polymerase sigma-70 factor (ECF subfamily)
MRDKEAERDGLPPETPRKDSAMKQQLPAEGGPTAENLPEPCEWLSRYGDSLYRYALSRLRRSHDAEEAVQETLLAALTRRSEFQGRSHPRTWLMGILKRKVVDRMRAAAREARETEPGNLDAWFDSKGKWRKSPRR